MSFIGNITGGLIGTSDAENAADDAAERSAAATKKTLEEMTAAFGLTEEQVMPWLETGQKAIGELWENRQGDPAAPELEMFGFDASQVGTSDAYKWRVDQGQRQLDRMSATNRSLTSGNRIAEGINYGQQMGSQEFESEFGRQLQTNTARNQTRKDQWAMESDVFRSYMDRLKGMGATGQNTAMNLGSMRETNVGNKANVTMGNVANQFAASLIPVQEKQNFISGLMGIAGQAAGAKTGGA